jgi:cell division protein FtsN
MNLRAMHLHTHGLVLAAAAGALWAAGCGHKQGAPIPAADANNIIGRLQEAQRRSDAHACHDLRTDTLPILQQQVTSLPQNVDSNVRATLQDGVSHLKDLIQQQCSTQTQTTTTPTTTTQTTPTQTTPTQTTPTQTTTTPRTTTTPHTTTTPTTTTTTPHTTTTPPAPTPPGQGGVSPPGQVKKGGPGGKAGD